MIGSLGAPSFRFLEGWGFAFWSAGPTVPLDSGQALRKSREGWGTQPWGSVNVGSQRGTQSVFNWNKTAKLSFRRAGFARGICFFAVTAEKQIPRFASARASVRALGMTRFFA
jgi:hypothetical protein